jgi:hypothetical protein
MATNYNDSFMSGVSVFEFPQVNLYIHKDGNPLCLCLNRETQALINNCKLLIEREGEKIMAKKRQNFIYYL